MKVEYKSPSKILKAGEILTANCTALVATNGTIVWQLLTVSKKYLWKDGQSMGSQKLPDWVNVTAKKDQEKHPIVWIKGKPAGNSFMVNNGVSFDSCCTAYLGRRTTMIFGVVYRGGVEGWFTQFSYNDLSMDLRASTFGVLKGNISIVDG
ncbi:hypothetical protein PoB_005575400 [Plakobranchus ocellatus]|uniref:Uncharacterized protein n=1 Tax=Plakobranchus ocellatus TaxID=259542 RepID=A0AAV4CES8_9GAST|nr:hypothetical protein PoB_005575400 [Plakobranchus ocellatus]